jgi:hypothetical protein
MSVHTVRRAAWLLLAFTLPAKRASKRVEIWRKLQRYGTVPLGNSGYLLPNGASNEARFQWLATAIRRYGGEASVVCVESIDNLTPAQLKGRFSEARAKEYQVLIQQIQRLARNGGERENTPRLSRLRNRFQEIVEIDFFDTQDGPYRTGQSKGIQGQSVGDQAKTWCRSLCFCLANSSLH